MKKLIVAALIAGFAAGPASASELEDYCVASEADLETLSDASKEAIATCWPDAA